MADTSDIAWCRAISGGIDATKGAFVVVTGGTTHDFENRSVARAGVLNLSYPGDFELHMPDIVGWFDEHPAGDALP